MLSDAIDSAPPFLLIVSLKPIAYIVPLSPN